ncbi:Uncharacterised protein [Mycobacteroides abscessus subsp. abscessus]|nr:Uncharacterised protein [Mycobacteroides abscessus subsp. abscessus]
MKTALIANASAGSSAARRMAATTSASTTAPNPSQISVNAGSGTRSRASTAWMD